ncbi:Peptidoglycan/LPS O-acetylase OafA/YrhL, contains acyltransferase and SGNH-hydrolase domains [Cetobacterium ceti]|uniref:Peptidoglycan/LPS O-acetylase OafA/YrhL, contains acyltransferase and SGNH-hydrolase domains n=1 Tax=Cetobacterium ceti TaxID=180163 RepID=A0A1T4LWE5_9FUSO|nr:acyltransferase family protein [Cetobacterium ceti]SJZ59063.1 Peptidoglycan/LPS O-acetylase OafA/YrhL, contains acyltransferase and SGNH-hydrolase domains [Cetobacterium ceti]
MKIDKEQTLQLKGIAILLLLYHHFYFETTNIILLNTSRYGKITVGIFTFLSGYGITASYLKNKKNNCSFLLKNIKKLYKTYWPIFIITIFIGTITNIRTLKIAYKSNVMSIFIWDIFGLSYLFYNKTFNTTWWYMSLIIVLYICYKPIYIYLNKGSFRNKTIKLILMMACLKIFPRILLKIYYNSYLLALSKVTYNFDYMSIFMIGCYTFLERDKIQEIIEKYNIVMILLLIVFSSIRIYKPNTKLDFIIVFLLCGIYINGNFYFQNFLEFLGKYSFEIFLTHTFLYYYYIPGVINITKYNGLNFIWFTLLSVAVGVITNKSLNKRL